MRSHMFTAMQSIDLLFYQFELAVGGLRDALTKAAKNGQLTDATNRMLAQQETLIYEAFAW